MNTVPPPRASVYSGQRKVKPPRRAAPGRHVRKNGTLASSTGFQPVRFLAGTSVALRAKHSNPQELETVFSSELKSVWGGESMPAKKSSAKALYCVHPGVAMVQKWVGELKAKTGRSLE